MNYITPKIMDELKTEIDHILRMNFKLQASLQISNPTKVKEPDPDPYGS